MKKKRGKFKVKKQTYKINKMMENPSKHQKKNLKKIKNMFQK